MPKNQKLKLFFGLLLFFILFYFFSYKLISSFNYDNDFGRDIYDMLGIVQGKLRLLGPGLSFGGFIAGPYYYYLFSIPLFISHENPIFILYLSVLLYSVSLVVFWYLLAKKNTWLSSLLFVGWLATSHYLVFSIRNPGNAFSYFWLIICFIILFLRKDSPFLITGLGFLAGVISNFHFVNLIIFIPLLMVRWMLMKKEKRMIYFFILGLLISFLPQVLFELRHGFIMLKNTFEVGSYTRFINRELLNTLPVSNNVFQNFIKITEYIKPWLQVSFWIILGLVVGFLWKNRNKIQPEEKTVILTALSSFLLLVILGRYQFVFHYFLPFILWMQVSLWFVLKQEKEWLKIIIFTIFMAVNISGFNKSIFLPVPRQLAEFDSFVKDLINQKLITKNDNYNLFVVRETPLVIAGWEYRFWLKKYGYDPMSSFDYNRSSKMLVIAEPGQIIDLANLKTWEFEQFGAYNMVREEKIDTRQVMLLEKK